ncbi:hypothetical protein HGRIS_009903 [Hohenbuehelia grisea]|uniref:Uncharacterized protein n=1 Tax=Hohenbuehelia grisea TaxID=104357 RepID=A0ABR3J352_9AGAR
MSYRSPSPFAPENAYAQPPSANQIAAGSVTYTTSTGPDGRTVYHPFKAVPASYQTPNGVVSGIQWVPAETTQILPAGAQPATADFTASWNRSGYLSKDDQKALKGWQKEEDKRRRKEEKESAKRLRDKDRRDREEVELRKAREMDFVAHERRKSFNAGQASPMAFPPGGASPGPGYPATAYTAIGGMGNNPAGGIYGPTPSAPTIPGYNRERKYSNSGVGGLDQQFNDMNMREHAERERKLSNSAMGRPRKYSMNEPDRTRRISGNLGDRPGAYGNPPGGYPPAGAPYPGASPNMRPVSPFMPGGAPSGYPAAPSAYPPSPRPGVAEPYPRSTTPFGPGGPQTYPRGHVLEGQPIQPRSRATTPIPGAIPGAGPPGAGGYGAFPQPTIPPSPRMPNSVAFPGGPQQQPQQQLAVPEGFSRPMNAAQPYTPFDTMKILDLDDFLEHLPRMPLVLQTHDVLHEDWIRLVSDLALAWAGKLPADPTRRPAKRSTLAADLIDLWNASFFFARGVELVLYKGRERRTGPRAGLADLPSHADDDDSSSSSSESSESESDDDEDRYAAGGYGGYGRPPQTVEMIEARRRRRERKAEKRRRRKERKQRRKAKARGNRYSLYLTCIPPGGQAGMGLAHGHGHGPGTPANMLPGGGSSYPGMMGTPSSMVGGY